MPARWCRVCNARLFDRPLLRYAAMPAVAQQLPDKDSLDADRGVDLELRQCTGCGLVQLTNDPVPYYRDVIRATGLSEEMRTFRLAQCKKVVEAFSLGREKALEVGCGKGDQLTVMQESGLRAFGLEHSHESVAHCRSMGLDAFQGFIDGPTKLDHGPYAAFFMLNFLEHLPDPTATLRGIHANLTPDAVGIVEVPNFDMILQERLFTELTTDHLTYFTARTLRTALDISGFDTVSCEPVWHKYILSATVRKKRPVDVSGFHDAQDRLARQMDDFLQRHGDRNVAVWGAGHQSFATIALLGIAHRIKYVVDSAPFKQGRCTPATHLPIVPPDWLKTDPVAAVLVIAGSYSDEVAVLLRRDFDNSLDIAILRPSGLEVA